MSFDGEQIANTAPEDDEINSVLWVGNLDSKVTEAMLYELFLQAGPIKSIKIPKGIDGAAHKGYCFIQFVHDASVPYTINVMDGTTLFGKKLKLQPRPNSIHRKAIPFQHPVGPPIMQIQIPQQTATAVQGPPQQSQQPTMVRGNYQGGTRTPVSVVQQAPPPPQINGFVQFMQPVPAGATQTQQQRNATAGNPQNASGIPSQFTQATSGPPLFQQRHQGPRGPRPPRHGHHNGHISNGNRMPYNNHHQQRFPPPQQQQQQQQQQQIQQHPPPQPLYFNPMFQGQSVHVVPAGSPVDHQQNHVESHQAYFRRHPHQQPTAMQQPPLPPGVVHAAANPTNT
ncbi:RNA-binding protein 7, partial [Orchesella cincta]